MNWSIPQSAEGLASDAATLDADAARWIRRAWVSRHPVGLDPAAALLRSEPGRSAWELLSTLVDEMSEEWAERPSSLTDPLDTQPGLVVVALSCAVAALVCDDLGNRERELLITPWTMGRVLYAWSLTADPLASELALSLRPARSRA